MSEFEIGLMVVFVGWLVLSGGLFFVVTAHWFHDYLHTLRDREEKE